MDPTKYFPLMICCSTEFPIKYAQNNCLWQVKEKPLSSLISSRFLLLINQITTFYHLSSCRIITNTLECLKWFTLPWSSLFSFHLYFFKLLTSQRNKKRNNNEEFKYQPPSQHSAHHQQLEVSHIQDKDDLSSFLPPKVWFVPFWWGERVRVAARVKLRAKLIQTRGLLHGITPGPAQRHQLPHLWYMVLSPARSGFEPLRKSPQRPA